MYTYILHTVNSNEIIQPHLYISQLFASPAMLSLPLVNRCSAIPRVPCIVPRRRWHFSGPRPAVAAAVVVTELARASGRGRLRRQARPMAWEVATKLVDAVNELRYSGLMMKDWQRSGLTFWCLLLLIFLF